MCGSQVEGMTDFWKSAHIVFSVVLHNLLVPGLVNVSQCSFLTIYWESTYLTTKYRLLHKQDHAKLAKKPPPVKQPIQITVTLVHFIQWT